MASIESQYGSNPAASGGALGGRASGSDLAHTGNLGRRRLLSFNGDDVLLPDEHRAGTRPAASTPASNIGLQKVHQWRREVIGPIRARDRFHRLLHCYESSLFHSESLLLIGRSGFMTHSYLFIPFEFVFFLFWRISLFLKIIHKF